MYKRQAVAVNCSPIHGKGAMLFAVDVFYRIAANAEIGGLVIFQQCRNEFCGLEAVAGQIDCLLYTSRGNPVLLVCMGGKNF